MLLKTKIINWLKSELINSGFEGVIVGISGGIDSAVVASLAKEAFPNNSFGMYIDIYNSSFSKNNALLIINELKIDHQLLNLNKAFNVFCDELNIVKNESNKIITGNIKARMRMVSLYAVAQQKKYLVLGTSNLSEIIIGYSTKWGDSAADLYPIASFTKKQVYELAVELNINKEIIKLKPSADLWENQNDEEELGFGYNDLENYLLNKEINLNIKNKIIKTIKKNKHKKIYMNKFSI